MDREPPDDQLLGLLIRRLHQHWALAIDSALNEAGFSEIRAPHANVFPFVPPEGISVSDLAKCAHVRKQTMAQAVEELEQLGYVERRPDPRDRRARLVLLTSRGRAVPPVAISAGRLVEARWAQLTSPGTLESLRRALVALLDQLQPEADTVAAQERAP